MSITVIKPFHQWKDEQIKLGVVKEKEWFYSEYGRYCNKVRNQKMKRELTSQEKEQSFETFEHIYQVQKRLLKAAFLIQQRCLTHDQSKMKDPEVELFTKMTPKLKEVEYGSDAYKEFLKELKPALDNHYAHNSHHPEHYGNIEGMNLIDIIEMLCDWIAATKRTKNGDIEKSFQINQDRFNMSPQLVSIMRNTVRMIE